MKNMWKEIRKEQHHEMNMELEHKGLLGMTEHVHPQSHKHLKIRM
jgi:hypothetical protein